MIPLTIAITLLGIAIVARMHPIRALGVLIASMYLYPEYLRVPLGLAQMSAPRFIALFLLARLLASPARQQFRWRLIDTLVLLEWGWAVIAGILAGAEFRQVTEQIGRVFDTVLVYYVARLAVSASQDYGKLLVPLGITAVVMGAVGVIESITYLSPYQPFTAYETFAWFDKTQEYRFGLLRAQGSLAHSIYFGMAMFLLLGVLFAIRGYCRPTWVWAVACAAALMGALSSMSSGPQQALVLLLIANLFFLRPRWIPPALAGLALLAGFLEIASNRHFWYLTEYINFFGGDYWYRGKLIEVAASQWRDYWLAGVGSQMPNHWGLLIDGRRHVDIVNQYIILAVSCGLPGLALFVGIEALALRESVSAWRAGDSRVRQLSFGLGATLVALAVAMLSVGLYSVPLLMTYTLLAFMAHVPIRRTALKRFILIERNNPATLDARGDRHPFSGGTIPAAQAF